MEIGIEEYSSSALQVFLKRQLLMVEDEVNQTVPVLGIVMVDVFLVVFRAAPPMLKAPSLGLFCVSFASDYMRQVEDEEQSRSLSLRCSKVDSLHIELACPH